MFLDRRVTGQTSNPSIMEHETLSRRTFHPCGKENNLSRVQRRRKTEEEFKWIWPRFRTLPSLVWRHNPPRQFVLPRILEQTNLNPALFSTRQRGGDPFSCGGDRRNCNPGWITGGGSVDKAVKLINAVLMKCVTAEAQTLIPWRGSLTSKGWGRDSKGCCLLKLNEWDVNSR